MLAPPPRFFVGYPRRMGGRIERNARVVLDYTLRNENGAIIDGSGSGADPIVYIHGYGMIVPGLERALEGLAAGDTKDVVVSPEDGHGPREDALIVHVPRAEMPLPGAVWLGDEVVAESPTGDESVLRVIEVGEDTVVLDGNHPLAGMTLRYSVVIREVGVASPAEIEEAAALVELSDQGQTTPKALLN